MVQIQCSIIGAGYGANPQSYRIPNIKGECKFTVLNATEAAPAKVTPLTSPFSESPVAQASNTVVNGGEVTIGQFIASGTFTYRVDCGANWLTLELQVEAA